MSNPEQNSIARRAVEAQSQPPAAGQAAHKWTVAKATQTLPGSWFIYIYEGSKTVFQVLGTSQEEVESRAAFIVEACNSHAGLKRKADLVPALVAALESYIAWHEGKCGSLSSSDKLREAKIQARAALAAAKTDGD